MATTRIERLQSSMRKIISEIIQLKMNNPKLGFISIPDVKVSSDFSNAKVFVSFLRKEDINIGMEILRNSKGFIRSELAKQMKTRRVPEICFELDDSFEKGLRIDELIAS